MTGKTTPGAESQPETHGDEHEIRKEDGAPEDSAGLRVPIQPVEPSKAQKCCSEYLGEP